MYKIAFFFKCPQIAEADVGDRDPRSIALVINHQTHKLMQVFNERMILQDHTQQGKFSKIQTVHASIYIFS